MTATSKSMSWVLLVLGVLTGCSSTEPVDLWIRSADVLVADGTTLPSADIGVRDGRIAFVGDSPPALQARDTLDGSGLTAMPGLVDTHTHLLTPFVIPASVGDAGPADLDPVLDSILFAHLEAGVTTILTLGDFWPAIRRVRDEIAGGERVGPRLLVAGPVLTSPGGKPTPLCRRDARCLEDFVREVEIPDAGRDAVRTLAEQGVDFIKVMYGGQGVRSRITHETLIAIVEEAHALGLPVAAHVDTAEEGMEALGSGVDLLAHPPGLEPPSPELLGLLRESGPPVVSTLKAVEGNRHEIIAALVRAGVPPVFGTDRPAGRSWTVRAAVLREMEALGTAGMTDDELVEAATSRAARALGQGEEFGSIEVGKAADLVLYDGAAGNPIAGLQAIRYVVGDGEVVVEGR